MISKCRSIKSLANAYKVLRRLNSWEVHSRQVDLYVVRVDVIQGDIVGRSLACVSWWQLSLLWCFQQWLVIIVSFVFRIQFDHQLLELK